MVTKEELLARKATLEADLLAQQQAAAAATQEIQDGQRKLAHSRDMINALSGAKQDVEHWLAKFPADPPAPHPDPDEPHQEADKPKELPN